MIDENTLTRGSMLHRLRALTRKVVDESGQGLAEYGFILMLVALAAIAALTGLGLAIAEGLDNVTGQF